MEQSLAITYTRPDTSLSPRDLLLIEQKGYGSAIGRVTKANLARYVGHYIFGPEYMPDVDCGLDAAGSCDTGVYVYPLLPGLAYRRGATHGTLGERVVEEVILSEQIRFALADRARTQYPAAEIISARPVGRVYDAGGADAPAPAVTIDGEELVLPVPLYCTLLVNYMVRRHYYSLEIPKREDALENRYSSVVWAAAAGGPPVWVAIQAPPGAEEFADDEADCGYGGGSTSFGGPEDPEEGEPVADGNSREQRRDWCTQEILSDETY